MSAFFSLPFSKNFFVYSVSGFFVFESGIELFDDVITTDDPEISDIFMVFDIVEEKLPSVHDPFDHV